MHQVVVQYQSKIRQDYPSSYVASFVVAVAVVVVVVVDHVAYQLYHPLIGVLWLDQKRKLSWMMLNEK